MLCALRRRAAGKSVQTFCMHIPCFTQFAHRRSTANTTAYISMPPCKNCFQTLVSAGITRIISRNRILDQVQDFITSHPPLSYVDIPDTEASIARRLKVVTESGRGPGTSKESILEARKKRKQMQNEEKVS